MSFDKTVAALFRERTLGRAIMGQVLKDLVQTPFRECDLSLFKQRLWDMIYRRLFKSSEVLSGWWVRMLTACSLAGQSDAKDLFCSGEHVLYICRLVSPHLSFFDLLLLSVYPNVVPICGACLPCCSHPSPAVRRACSVRPSRPGAETKLLTPN